MSSGIVVTKQSSPPDAKAAQPKVRTFLVDAEIVHRVTDKEYFAEQAKINYARDAPKRAFLKRMADGKRRKNAQASEDAVRSAALKVAALAKEYRDREMMMEGEHEAHA